jgi:molybdopterin-containing oxidoreductase family membrane subunit
MTAGRPDIELHEPVVRPAVITEGQSFTSVTEKIAGLVLAERTPVSWMILAYFALVLTGVFVVSVSYLLYEGVGIWGIKIPVAWGFAITNFVWWIGIGHAGTLISAILLLLNQKWRNSINRFAEAMTLFAVACAGMYPLLHLGRPWLFYWLFPYPNTMSVQPQFRSPLVWDVFAVSTYATVSLLFWYLGLLPDLATFRDRARSRVVASIYGVLSLGWRGSSKQWRYHNSASLLLAGLATPLVLSVHTVVSFDFTIAILPGWHSTIFPPYFVAGAIYSGFAMVLLLAIPIRYIYRLQGLITERHLDNSAKVMLATGLVLAYAYVIEPFTAWYGGNEFEMYAFWNRAFGPYWWAFWSTIACNVVIPQVLWSSRVRRNTFALFFVSVAILYGMWIERYVIIVSSLHRDYLPSSWGEFFGTGWDHATFYGSMGIFLLLFLLFIRFLPMMSIYEVRELVEDNSSEEVKV